MTSIPVVSTGIQILRLQREKHNIPSDLLIRDDKNAGLLEGRVVRRLQQHLDVGARVGGPELVLNLARVPPFLSHRHVEQMVRL